MDELFFCHQQRLEQLLRLLVQRTDDGAGLRNGIKPCAVDFVSVALIKQLQTASALVQNARELLVKNHLRQLSLDHILWQANNLGNMRDLKEM